MALRPPTQAQAMATVEPLPADEVSGLIRFHHGTSGLSATQLLHHGVDQQLAAASNVTGEFWATTDHAVAEYFARSHPNAPPAACFEFDLPETVLRVILTQRPPGATRHGAKDVEFHPSSFAVLNSHSLNRQVIWFV